MRRSAFSLRRNARLLLVPPAGHLRPLDGMRALSILWVVLFHAAFYTAVHVPLASYAALLGAPWMLPIWRGDFGVDVFFVLSGFLIAGMLLDERASTGRVRLGLFYVRRVMRLWPALVVAVGIDAFAFHDHPRMAWANLLYVSNFVHVLGSCMPWTWSLSIEEQFYLVCPWLLRALWPLSLGPRLLALGVVATGMCAAAACAIERGGFHASDAEIVFNRDIFRWAAAFDELYSKPWMRAGPLLAGVTAAFLFRERRVMCALGQATVGSSVGLLVALCAVAVSTHWPLVSGAPRAVELAFLAVYRTVFGAAVAYALLLSLSRHPVGVALSRVLSARAFYPVAQLAYSAYLLNPIVTNVVHHALAPRVAHGEPPMALFLPFDVLGTFAAAAALHLIVERPLMVLRPRPELASLEPVLRQS